MRQTPFKGKWLLLSSKDIVYTKYHSTAPKTPAGSFWDIIECVALVSRECQEIGFLFHRGGLSEWNGVQSACSLGMIKRFVLLFHNSYTFIFLWLVATQLLREKAFRPTNIIKFLVGCWLISYCHLAKGSILAWRFVFVFFLLIIWWCWMLNILLTKCIHPSICS